MLAVVNSPTLSRPKYANEKAAVNSVASYCDEQTAERDKISYLRRGRVIGPRVSAVLPLLRLRPSIALDTRKDFVVSGCA